MLTFIVGALIFHDGKLLLIHHKRLKVWMHPGGHVELGEFFDDALKREVKEETGLNIAIIDYGDDHVNDRSLMKRPFRIRKVIDKGKISSNEVILDYLCLVKGSSKVKLQKSELSGYRWVDRQGLKKVDTIPEIKKMAVEAFGYIDNMRA